MASGVYRIIVGKLFYVGSSSKFISRQRDHFWRLRKGTHPVETLQKEYDKLGDVIFEPLEYMYRGKDESDTEFRDRLRAAEQKKIDELFADPLWDGLIVNRSRNARGPDCSELMRKKWQEPEFREKMMSFLNARKGVPISDETRKRMSNAKRGANSPVAMPMEVYIPCPGHGIGPSMHLKFETITDMAKYLNVSQQAATAWVNKGAKPTFRTFLKGGGTFFAMVIYDTAAFRKAGDPWQFFGGRDNRCGGWPLPD